MRPALCLALALSAGWIAPQQRKLVGTGDALSEPIELAAGVLMVGGAHKGERNFIVQLRGPSDDLLINTVGPYTGVRLIPVKAGPHQFQVESSAPWTLLYEQPSPTATASPLPITQAMTGDAPLGPFQMPAGLVSATFRHSGSRNFIAMLYHADGRLAALLVNKVGAYSGTTAERVTAGTYWLAVQADGPWTVTLK